MNKRNVSLMDVYVVQRFDGWEEVPATRFQTPLVLDLFTFIETSSVEV